MQERGAGLIVPMLLWNTTRPTRFFRIAAVATARLLATNLTGRQVQAVHGPADLRWTDAAAALSTATGRTIAARQITDDEQRAPCAERA